jgi:hypothetical protein
MIHCRSLRLIVLSALVALAEMTIACSTPGPPRPYIDVDSYARYYATESGHILRVDGDGTILDVTCLSPNEVKGIVRSALSRTSCAKGTVAVIGQAKQTEGDWDLTSYGIAPETGTCKSLFPYFRSEWLEGKRHSCWHRLWEVPTAAVAYPSVAVLGIGLITAPVWVPILLFL